MANSLDFPEESPPLAESRQSIGSARREFDQAALALYNGELDYVDLVARQLYRSFRPKAPMEPPSE